MFFVIAIGWVVQIVIRIALSISRKLWFFSLSLQCTSPLFSPQALRTEAGLVLPVDD